MERFGEVVLKAQDVIAGKRVEQRADVRIREHR